MGKNNNNNFPLQNSAGSSSRVSDLDYIKNLTPKFHLDEAYLESIQRELPSLNLNPDPTLLRFNAWQLATSILIVVGHFLKRPQPLKLTKSKPEAWDFSNVIHDEAERLERQVLGALANETLSEEVLCLYLLHCVKCAVYHMRKDAWGGCHHNGWWKTDTGTGWRGAKLPATLQYLLLQSDPRYIHEIGMAFVDNNQQFHTTDFTNYFYPKFSFKSFELKQVVPNDGAEPPRIEDKQNSNSSKLTPHHHNLSTLKCRTMHCNYVLEIVHSALEKICNFHDDVAGESIATQRALSLLEMPKRSYFVADSLNETLNTCCNQIHGLRVRIKAKRDSQSLTQQLKDPNKEVKRNAKRIKNAMGKALDELGDIYTWVEQLNLAMNNQQLVRQLPTFEHFRKLPKPPSASGPGLTGRFFGGVSKLVPDSPFVVKVAAKAMGIPTPGKG